jgi:hypothetical protein
VAAIEDRNYVKLGGAEGSENTEKRQYNNLESLEIKKYYLWRDLASVLRYVPPQSRLRCWSVTAVAWTPWPRSWMETKNFTCGSRKQIGRHSFPGANCD